MARNKRADQKRLIAVLETTPIIEYACRKTGISRATFYRWRKSDLGFADKVDEALASGVDLVNDLAESQLIKLIKDSNLTAIIFWLKYRHPVYKKVFLAKANIKEKPDFFWPIPQEIIDEADRVITEYEKANPDKAIR